MELTLKGKVSRGFKSFFLYFFKNRFSLSIGTLHIFFCNFEYGLNSRRFSTKPKGLLIKLKDDVEKKIWTPFEQQTFGLHSDNALLSTAWSWTHY